MVFESMKILIIENNPESINPCLVLTLCQRQNSEVFNEA